MKIVIITSRAAASHIKRMVSGIPDVKVVELPLNVIGIATVDALARIITRRSDLIEEIRWGDVALIPGSVRGDASTLSKIVGIPVFKGTKSSGGIPFLIDYIRKGGSLDPIKPAEEVLGSEPTLEQDRAAFSIGKVPIPARGPPLVLASEILPETPSHNVAAEARRLAVQGARIIVVGASTSWDPEELARRVALVEGALEEEDVVVASEAPTVDHVKAAVASGAEMIFTSPHVAVEAAQAGIGDVAYVVGDRNVNALKIALAALREVGVEKVLVDPVVDIPPLGMSESISRYIEASRLGAPLLFSAANAANEVEADTHGVHAILALIAVELRASVYLVVEDSWKNRWSTSEAREALRLAWEAWRRGTSEKGLFSNLLIIKDPVKPPSMPSSGAHEVGWVPPRLDPRGYLVIGVDHDEGFIVVEWRPLKGGSPVKLRGRHALSLARTLTRMVGLDPEHSAYLGYELAKAEIALHLGKSYTQDEPIVLPVWRFEWLARGLGPSEGDIGR